MNHPELLNLRRRLAPTDLTETVEAGERTPAAVLVPLFVSQNELQVVFIRRADSLSSHGGQVAFPGGRVEPADPDFLATALRESQEEVGLAARDVTVLGRLQSNFTLTSRFFVIPFVGLIPADVEMRAGSGEVAEIFSVPMAALRAPAYRGEYRWPQRETSRVFPAIFYGGHVIWGLTFRITEELLSLSQAAR